MTDNTSKSFAYRLFQVIRANKKALQAQIPAYPENFDMKEREQYEQLRRLIDTMFQFERFCRGAQPALAGANEPQYFTVTTKRNVHPDVCYLNFVNEAARRAQHIVWLILNCQGQLCGATWQMFLAIEGLNTRGFRAVAHVHVANDRLPDLVKQYPGFSAALDNTSLLEMEFVNGAAVNKLKHDFTLADTEGWTLEQQIVRVNRYWTEIKLFAREAAKDPKNWPSLIDSRNVEQESVKGLLTNILRGLSQEQKALMRKYPDLAWRVFASQL